MTSEFKVVTITGKDNNWRMTIKDEEGNVIASGKAKDMKTVHAMCAAAQVENTTIFGYTFTPHRKFKNARQMSTQSVNDLVDDLNIALANQRKLSREKGDALREMQELKLLVRDLLEAYELIKETGNVPESIETLNKAIQDLEKHMTHQPKLFDEKTRWQR